MGTGISKQTDSYTSTFPSVSRGGPLRCQSNLFEYSSALSVQQPSVCLGTWGPLNIIDIFSFYLFVLYRTIRTESYDSP